MKKVAILNTCISGSTGKIAVGLYNALQSVGYEVHFYYGREDGEKQENYHRVGNNLNMYLHAGLSKFLGLQGFGSLIPTKKMLLEWDDIKIDTVYLVSPHGYYLNEKLFWEYIIANGINVIYLMIDEYAYLGNCGYRNDCCEYQNGCKKCPRMSRNILGGFIKGSARSYNMKRYVYAKCKGLTFVGPQFTVEQAKLSPLMQNSRLSIIDEAINTEFYHPRNVESLRKELGISNGELVCVCVAPFSYERKGCKYFVELAKRFAGNTRYRFVHVGFNVDPKSVDLPCNYIPIGFVKDQEKLAQYYSLGDIFVFPSLQDTMPNACLEALSSGTPLLLFNISGMPYIADDSVATFVEPRNVDQMKDAVLKINKKNPTTIEACRNYALMRYNNIDYYKKLISIGESEE